MEEIQDKKIVDDEVNEENVILTREKVEEMLSEYSLEIQALARKITSNSEGRKVYSRKLKDEFIRNHVIEVTPETKEDDFLQNTGFITRLRKLLSLFLSRDASPDLMGLISEFDLYHHYRSDVSNAIKMEDVMGLCVTGEEREILITKRKKLLKFIAQKAAHVVEDWNLPKPVPEKKRTLATSNVHKAAEKSKEEVETNSKERKIYAELNFSEIFAQFRHPGSTPILSPVGPLIIPITTTANTEKVSVAHIIPAVAHSRSSVEDFHLKGISQFSFNNRTDEFLIFSPGTVIKGVNTQDRVLIGTAVAVPHETLEFGEALCGHLRSPCIGKLQDRGILLPLHSQTPLFNPSDPFRKRAQKKRTGAEPNDIGPTPISPAHHVMFRELQSFSSREVQIYRSTGSIYYRKFAKRCAEKLIPGVQVTYKENTDSFLSASRRNHHHHYYDNGHQQHLQVFDVLPQSQDSSDTKRSLSFRFPLSNSLHYLHIFQEGFEKKGDYLFYSLKYLEVLNLFYSAMKKQFHEIMTEEIHQIFEEMIHQDSHHNHYSRRYHHHSRNHDSNPAVLEMIEWIDQFFDEFCSYMKGVFLHYEQFDDVFIPVTVNIHEDFVEFLLCSIIPEEKLYRNHEFYDRLRYFLDQSIHKFENTRDIEVIMNDDHFTETSTALQERLVSERMTLSHSLPSNNPQSCLWAWTQNSIYEKLFQTPMNWLISSNTSSYSLGGKEIGMFVIEPNGHYYGQVIGDMKGWNEYRPYFLQGASRLYKRDPILSSHHSDDEEVSQWKYMNSLKEKVFNNLSMNISFMQKKVTKHGNIITCYSETEDFSMTEIFYHRPHRMNDDQEESEPNFQLIWLYFDGNLSGSGSVPMNTPAVEEDSD